MLMASAGTNGPPLAVTWLTMSCMPSRGAPFTTGRSDEPGRAMPCSRNDRCETDPSAVFIDRDL